MTSQPITFDVVMVCGGKDVHPGFELKLFPGQAEDNGVQHDVV